MSNPESEKISQRETGLVVKRMKGFYYVEIEGKVHLCRVKGNLFEHSHYDHKIAVGDQVIVDLHASEDAGWIYEILPRKNKLSRTLRDGMGEQVLVSNADHLLIVASLAQPAFHIGVIERFLIAAQRGGLHPVIVLNKIDLVISSFYQPIQELYHALNYQVLLTSVPENKGIDELRAVLEGQTSIFAGHSGVGKSSLVKALYPEWKIRIGQVDGKMGKGRHTTSLAEMYPLPGAKGYIVDTPGIREIGLYDVNKEELAQFFPEFEELRVSCKFRGCTHLHEPHCAIKVAMQEGAISELRYQSYRNIYESLS
ncbi:ribosome small subunit-dependent GTPase A [Deltaproteobacteria bacterium TL4]